MNNFKRFLKYEKQFKTIKVLFYDQTHVKNIPNKKTAIQSMDAS